MSVGFYLLYICSPDAALYDYLKEEAGWCLSDRLFDLKKEIKVAADIGRVAQQFPISSIDTDIFIHPDFRLQQGVRFTTHISRNR